MNYFNWRYIVTISLLSGIVFASFSPHANTPPQWTEKEIQILYSLSLDRLPALPEDKSNKIENNDTAASLGHHLFFDTRLSATKKIACATCHQPNRYFTDGLSLAKGVADGKRNSMTIVGVAYSPWFFWDGRKDSLWSQALGPLENPLEHAVSRMHVVQKIYRDSNYKYLYEMLFGELPNLADSSRFPVFTGPVNNNEWRSTWNNMTKDDQQIVNSVFANIGKTIAAYERKLLPGFSRYDHYVDGVISGSHQSLTLLNRDEIAGLKLFIGKAQCINCHNGPLLTNHEFHNTGIPPVSNQFASYGRAQGIWKAMADTFNCVGTYSDASEDDCAELKYTRTGHELVGTHKVPTLRNVANTGPYMHAGQFSTLYQVIDHYNHAPQAAVGENETNPLNLSKMEKNQLIKFLRTLTGPINTDKKWLNPPTILD